MRVVIKPIIKPVSNPSINYREFDEVDKISSTMSGNYILVHRDGKSKVEFHLPNDCYLIVTLDDKDTLTNIDMV